MLKKMVWGVVVLGLLALAACSPTANAATSAATANPIVDLVIAYLQSKIA